MNHVSPYLRLPLRTEGEAISERAMRELAAFIRNGGSDYPLAAQEVREAYARWDAIEAEMARTYEEPSP